MCRGLQLQARFTAGVAETYNKQQQEDTTYRFACPYPGCKRTFAELWRLRVHHRAAADVRGSGKERGHGTELTECPRCQEALEVGKLHVHCAGGYAAPRQAAKRHRRLEVLKAKSALRKRVATPHQADLTALSAASTPLPSSLFVHTDFKLTAQSAAEVAAFSCAPAVCEAPSPGTAAAIASFNSAAEVEREAAALAPPSAAGEDSWDMLVSSCIPHRRDGSSSPGQEVSSRPLPAPMGRSASLPETAEAPQGMAQHGPAAAPPSVRRHSAPAADTSAARQQLAPLAAGAAWEHFSSAQASLAAPFPSASGLLSPAQWDAMNDLLAAADAGSAQSAVARPVVQLPNSFLQAPTSGDWTAKLAPTPMQWPVGWAATPACSLGSPELPDLADGGWPELSDSGGPASPSSECCSEPPVVQLQACTQDWFPLPSLPSIGQLLG